MFSTTTKEAANITKESAAHDVKNAAGNLKREMRDASGSVRGAADDVVSELSAYANKAGRKVSGLIHSASDELVHAADKVTSEIRTNPVRSSMIALGVGVLVGALLRRS